MEKLTKKWLEGENASQEAIDIFVAQKETDRVKILKLLIRKNKLELADWLIVRFLDYKSYVSYTVYAAKKILVAYEKEFPDDDRPRKVIEVAGRCIKNSLLQNESVEWGAVESAAWKAAGSEWGATESAAWKAACKKVQIKILRHGIKLCEVRNEGKILLDSEGEEIISIFYEETTAGKK